MGNSAKGHDNIKVDIKAVVYSQPRYSTTVCSQQIMAVYGMAVYREWRYIEILRKRNFCSQTSHG